MTKQKQRLVIVQWGSYRSFPVGGISTFVESILPGLADAFDVKLVGMGMGEPLGSWTQVEVDGRKFDFLPVVNPRPSKLIPDRLRLLWAITKYRSALAAVMPDAYYVHMTEAAIPLLGYRVPVILHVHGLYNLFRFSRHCLGALFAILYERVYPWLFSRCAKVIGAGTAEEFSRFCRTMRVQSGTVMPTCVRRKIFFQRDRAEARRELGISREDKVLLYVGRLTETKNPLLLMQAGEILCRRLSNVKLVFVGDGPLRPDLAARAQMTSKITITGRLSAEQTASWMNAADVLTVVSKAEAFTSIVALEALSCGTPVVATPVSALPEMIRAGVNGRIAKGFDPYSYASAAESVLAEPPARERCVQSVIEYSSEKIASRIVHEIRSTIRDSRCKAGSVAALNRHSPRCSDTLPENSR